jgi:Zn-finger nucleic acid-binding protein
VSSSGSAPRYDKDDGCGEYSHHGRSYKKRKKNFLEELFD